jgi:mediator of replication checkpoint protein 1
MRESRASVCPFPRTRSLLTVIFDRASDGERARDEKQVEKLFKDITTGMLRRKRGAEYGDLSDSDDGGEARRRLKRRQFAKMQRALFADERIGKIAENPRNMAFLKSIEDRGSDEEMDFIMQRPMASSVGLPGATQQDESQGSAVPDSQPHQAVAMGPPTAAAAATRPIASSRRTKDGKRPANISQIRESLSSLLEEPSHGIIPATDPSSDHSDSGGDGEDPQEQEARQATTKRQRERRTAVAVVDRITLKRNASTASLSSHASTTGSTTQRLAFATAANAQGPFKVPALLRRATTNSLMSTGSSASTSTAGSGKENRGPGTASAGAGSGFGDEAKIKRGAGKRSGINYFARENERRAALAESEKRREAKRWKGAEGRGKLVGGLFGGGRFE